MVIQTSSPRSTSIAAFLMWTAEPKMMDRKYTGFVGVSAGSFGFPFVPDQQETLGALNTVNSVIL